MTNPNETASAVKHTAELVKELHKPQLLEINDGVDVLAVPDGIEIRSVKPLMDEYLTRPERRRGTATFDDLASFVAHAKRFKDADSTLWLADPKRPALLSVLDYHRAGHDSDPRFGEHRGRYLFPLSDEWEAWTAIRGKDLDQHAFAEFLETRILDFVDPAKSKNVIALAEDLGSTPAKPSQILILSRGIKINEEVKVVSATNLSSGEAQIVFESKHRDEAGAQLKVPDLCAIAIPIFRDGAPYVIAVRLRYRLKGGAISWRLEMYRPDRYLADAVNEAASSAQEATGLPLYKGTPE